jgi:DNA polymerase-3 subunit alpha
MAGQDVTLAAIVASTRQIYTRDGRPFLAAQVEDVSGSLEVTVWPDVYQQQQELWEAGNTLLLNVRVRTRDGRLNLAVLQASPYEDGQPSAVAEEEPVWDVMAAPLQQLAVNGASMQPSANGAAVTTLEAAPVTPAPPPPRRHRLVITMRETEDEEGDRQRLAAVMDALALFPGDAEVILEVRSNGASETLALPSARACPELIERLRSVLGAMGEAVVETIVPETA